MATRKVVNKSSKKTQSKSNSRTQRAGRRVKKVTSKRRGGFLSTIATAAVPFGLVALKRAYSKRHPGAKGVRGKPSRALRATVRRLRKAGRK